MNTDLKIALFFASIVLSIYIALYNYLDISRYHLIDNTNDVIPFIEKYKKLEPYNKLDIVVSLKITDETDLKKIQPTLLSLLDQTIKTRIILNLPEDKSKYTIPEKYTDFLFIVDNLSGYGMYTNLIPVIEQKSIEQGTKIVVINNNRIIYGKDFIQKLVDINKKNKDALLVVKPYLQKDKEKCLPSVMLLEPDFFKKNLDDFNDTCSWYRNAILDTIKIKEINYFENYEYQPKK